MLTLLFTAFVGPPPATHADQTLTAPGLSNPTNDPNTVSCRHLPGDGAPPDLWFADLSRELCDMLLHAEQCPVSTSGIYNDAAADATVVALPDRFFDVFAAERDRTVVPIALQRYDAVLLRTSTCADLNRSLWTGSRDQRTRIAASHITFLHELAHVVDYRTGYRMSDELAAHDIERGLGHAHGDHEWRELFAFCAARLQWMNHTGLTRIELSQIWPLHYDRSTGTPSASIALCPRKNRVATTEILNDWAAAPTGPYFDSFGP